MDYVLYTTSTLPTNSSIVTLLLVPSTTTSVATIPTFTRRMRSPPTQPKPSFDVALAQYRHLDHPLLGCPSHILSWLLNPDARCAP
jgi:hypothetical protein